MGAQDGWNYHAAVDQQRERLVSVITTNRDVFALDPTVGDIPNLGVAKVRNPEDEGDWATLEWELRSFVCEGEYERGLERILDQFLSHLSQPEQPAAWVSGFYGSGKSHLMRVLEYLWRDYELPSGVSARGVDAPARRHRAHLAELSLAGKREGGLWSAAGTLGAGAAGSVRLAFLEIVLGAAGLPQQYAPARLALWMKNEGLYDACPRRGRGSRQVLRPRASQPLRLAGACRGADRRRRTVRRHAGRRSARRCRRSSRASRTSATTRCSNVFEDVLRLQSDKDGKLPLTLVVLDEMQQYINDDNAKAEHVQHLVEGCSSRFGSRVLVVATGQAALTANADAAEADRSLRGLGRAVRHRRRDRRPPGRPAQEAGGRRRRSQTTLDKHSGEIDQHLARHAARAHGCGQGRARRRLPASPDAPALLGASAAGDRQGRQGGRSPHAAQDRSRGRPQRRRPAARNRHRRRLRVHARSRPACCRAASC